MELGSIALDIIFPPRCPVCGGIIPIDKRIVLYGIKCKAADKHELSPYICHECIPEFKFIEPPFCIKCGKQLYKSSVSSERSAVASAGLCSDCKKTVRNYTACRCLITYDELAQDVLIGIKYHGRSESAVLLGILAAQRFKGWISEISPDFIVPVPVHKERLRKRGYNQAGIIAGEIGSICGIPVITDILKRSRNTNAMKDLDMAERAAALEEAFSADIRHSEAFNELIRGKRAAGNYTKIRHAASLSRVPDKVFFKEDRDIRKGLTALIVDDIYTTGATLEACANCLIRAGIPAVYGLCIAAGTDVIKA